jgi:OmpA-OmpF porin, OOP family
MKKLSIVCALAFGGMLASGPAGAQVKDGIGVDNFEPAIGWQNFLTVHGPNVVAHKQLGLQLYLDYQRDPFTLDQCTSGGTTCNSLATKTAVIQNGLQAYLAGAFGIKDIAQIGLGVPIALSMSSNGTELAPTGMTGGSFSKTALGDLYVEGKFDLAHAPHGIGVAATVGLTLPTGDQNAYAGEKNPTGRIRAIAGVMQGPFYAAANVGAIIRGESLVIATGDPDPMTGKPATIDIGSQLIYGGAVAWQLPRFARPVRVMGELFGRHAVDNNYLDSSPLEGDIAVRVNFPHALQASVGGGFGIIRGIGSPLARGFLGITWAPDYRDRDGDGIPDMDDQCPDEPEDRDGYKDEDGCPDPDNDGDGIPDNLDKCPNEPEDMDGFQDADGCPDPDNDQDGIPDLKDACPNAPEDHKGRFPNDGCPEDVVDSDGDGIPDIRDKCPDEPEDKDGFEDADGCPDPDNDKDGVPDQYDECPNEPEDQDGFQDEDGCPDPDNDKDGIPDKLDKCPNEPETINGIKDDDGCPDVGPEHVKIVDAEITIDEPVVFTKAKLAHTAWLLDQLAQILRGHVELTKIRVESHKQAGESDADAQKRGAAVKEYLVKKGVEADRLNQTVVATPGPTVQFFVEARKDEKHKGKK